jgi:Alr-MurF fusion protein
VQNITTIATITGATVLTQASNSIIQYLLLDSRKLLFAEHCLFFAINTKYQSANIFIPELYQKGVRNFIVDASFALQLNNLPEANIVQVANVVTALQQVAAFNRLQFNIPVIGITGSNGKTIVKEWLYQLLQNSYTIARSPKSYNSQIGVPLSVWQLNAQHTLGIFEAGISLPNEMLALQQIIQPTIGVFTSLGDAHAEGFASVADKVQQKILLFTDVEIIIYPYDIDVVRDAINQNYPTKKTIAWGTEAGANFVINSTQIQLYNTIIKATYNGNKYSLNVPFTNTAAIENAITCWCILLHLNIPEPQIVNSFTTLQAVEMRLEMKQGINNCTIINDSYSADITSLNIALDFLAQQQNNQKRTVILSDILQSGKKANQLYAEVAALLQQKNISRFIGIGPELTKNAEVFSQLPQAQFFISAAQFKEQFKALPFFNETILLKGARVFEFEALSNLLEQKQHNTVLEVNLSALIHNYRVHKNVLAPNTKIMAMVKAFSYGSGAFEIANTLQHHNADYLAVAYTDEGVALRQAGIKLPIMVMNVEPAAFDNLVKYNLEPELYCNEIYQAFKNYLLTQGLTAYPVHIKIDTGMKRLGFETPELPALINDIVSAGMFKIQSVFSHLAASDSPIHQAFTLQQAEAFNAACALFKTALSYPFLMHLANTSAIQQYPNMQYNMVRLGIGMYGFTADATMQQQLRTVAVLKTTVAQLKQVVAGQTIGYGRMGVAKQNTTIATVRIGYADGYPRNLSNGIGKMFFNGTLVPVIGNICMDMLMLDVTACPNIKVGDTIEVFGQNISAATLAQWAGTISYEVLTNVSQRVNRVYFEE